MERFSTARLTAEKLREDHLADLVSLHLDPEVSRYLGGVRSPDATQKYLTVNMAHWDRYGFGLWVLRAKTGESAGRAGIRYVAVENAEEVEVFYTFKRSMWGQGLATEISEALTRIGLRELKLPSLVGLVFVDHRASRHVLEKTNYVFERNVIYHGEETALYRSPPAARVVQGVPAPNNG
jgi:RimJ/RimL family protein N-acetyltransferase